MKTHKNIFLSLSFFLAAAIWVVLWILPGKDLLLYSPSNTIEATYIIPHFVLVIIGIFFSLKSNKRKESPWMGSLLGVIGILWLIFVSLGLYLASMQ